jgi:hypothetical protein
MADLNERVSKLETARKEMEEAMVVMAHLEARSASRIKEHAEFLAAHETAMRESDSKLAAHTIAMTEFDSKLNALIDIVSRMQGGMESRQ